MKISDPRTPKFYALPKIHKKGNPVVSSINCHTSNIPKFVDHPLQPIVKQIPSYIKDLNDFLPKLNAMENVPKDRILLTMDVKSLYTNILNNEGISAIKNAYKRYPQKTILTKVIITFVAVILTLNIFTFSCKHYLPIIGWTMGTVCAPSYANILNQNLYAP